MADCIVVMLSVERSTVIMVDSEGNAELTFTPRMVAVTIPPDEALDMLAYAFEDNSTLMA